MQPAAEAMKLVLQRGQVKIELRLQAEDRKIIAAGWRLNLAAMRAEQRGIIVANGARPTGYRNRGIENFEHGFTLTKLKLLRERRTAAAGARGVRIDEGESLAHQRLFIVQRHAVQVDERLGIDEDSHTIKFINAVALAGLRVELDGIRKPRASAAYHAQAQSALCGRDAFLGQGHANALNRFFRQLQFRLRHLRWGQLRLRRKSTFRWLRFYAY